MLREYGNEALLIVHTFEDRGELPVEISDEVVSIRPSGYSTTGDKWKIKESFGSELDGDFRGKVFWLEK